MKFKYCDIYLNRGNLFPLPAFNLYQRLNYVLNLNKSYEELFQNFRNSYKQLLKKNEQVRCKILKDIDIEEMINLTKEQLNPLFNIPERNYLGFKQLYEILKKENRATNYGVYSPNGELVASGIFFFSQGRAYYVLAGNHPDGRTLGASHQVINSFIKDNAGQELILDFEGSNVNSIAFFFKSFGAREEKYPGLLYNRLPFWLRWVKN